MGFKKMSYSINAQSQQMYYSSLPNNTCTLYSAMLPHAKQNKNNWTNVSFRRGRTTKIVNETQQRKTTLSQTRIRLPFEAELY
jgi:hypothetical protein